MKVNCFRNQHLSLRVTQTLVPKVIDLLLLNFKEKLAFKEYFTLKEGLSGIKLRLF